MMFYQGDLQSGIALAVTESKSVICFVRDESEESLRWEEEYFNDEIGEFVQANAVILRLIAGTLEAGFLTSLCPVNSYPTVVVIRNGTLQEYIVSGTTKEEFQKRIETALTSTSSNPSITIPPASQPSPASQAPPVLEASQPQSSQPAEQTSWSPPVTRPTQSQTQETDVARRESVRAGKQKVESTQETETSEAVGRQKKDLKEWREQQRKLEQQRKEERERIRQQIKKDKEERKNRDTRTKTTTTAATSQTPSNESPASSKPQQYRLQVRLFDGASVRNSFPPAATIREDVRPWLDAQRSDGSQPYTLKHILTPLPNHSISISEEEQTLESLELGPTANLVMVPVQTYIEAYSSSSTASLPVRAISSGYSLFSGAVGAVAGTVGSFLGYGTTPASASQQQTTANSESGIINNHRAGNINIRTLHDRHSETTGPREFYNGNQLNFEPSRDDGTKED